MLNKTRIEKIKQQAKKVLLSKDRVEVDEDGVPCFITVSGEDAYREGRDPGERQAITAIVKHNKKDKYLLLRWKKIDWHTFITGGIEKGQTAEEAARAEVLEETGYKNLKLIKELSRTNAKFYHTPKQTNRTAQFTNFYFVLENEEQDNVDEAERNKHEMLWVERDKVENLLVSSGMRFLWRELADF